MEEENVKVTIKSGGILVRKGKGCIAMDMDICGIHASLSGRKREHDSINSHLGRKKLVITLEEDAWPWHECDVLLEKNGHRKLQSGFLAHAQVYEKIALRKDAFQAYEGRKSPVEARRS